MGGLTGQQCFTMVAPINGMYPNFSCFLPTFFNNLFIAAGNRQTILVILIVKVT